MNADERFAIIAPLLTLRYHDRASGIRRQARLHGIGERTIYRWLSVWKRGGFSALRRKQRTDSGGPRLEKASGIAYIADRVIRDGGVLGTIRKEFRRYTSDATRPRLSYETFRVWFKRFSATRQADLNTAN